MKTKFYIEWRSSIFSYKRLFYTHEILTCCWKRDWKKSSHFELKISGFKNGTVILRVVIQVLYTFHYCLIDFNWPALTLKGEEKLCIIRIFSWQRTLEAKDYHITILIRKQNGNLNVFSLLTVDWNAWEDSSVSCLVGRHT